MIYHHMNIHDMIFFSVTRVNDFSTKLAVVHGIGRCLGKSVREYNNILILMHTPKRIFVQEHWLYLPIDVIRTLPLVCFDFHDVMAPLLERFFVFRYFFKKKKILISISNLLE